MYLKAANLLLEAADHIHYIANKLELKAVELTRKSYHQHKKYVKMLQKEVDKENQKAQKIYDRLQGWV